MSKKTPHKPLSVKDLDLPKIEGRDPYSRPASHLEREGADGWKEAPGRRTSNTLLVNAVRREVDAWRDNGYVGVSETSRRLLRFWFHEDHMGDGHRFRYYFCQQEAVETVVYLAEVRNLTDAAELIGAYFEQTDLLGLQFVTASNGDRYVRRYIPEINKDADQILPPQGLPRYAVKMATGSGKTMVMALLTVWSFFHRRLEKGSRMADHFLLIAPNVIVYERLAEDFSAGKIFWRLPMIPPEWRRLFTLQCILRGDAADAAHGHGALFLTNIQQIYAQEAPPPPVNPIAAILGNAPKLNARNAVSMLDRILRLPNLMVLNDEAHHVHDDELAWNKTLLALHDALKSKYRTGLHLWLDFSATPKNQNGTYFPWIVVDYPLAQAVEDRIVKAPLIIHQTDKKDPDKYASKDAGDAYSEWITIAMQRWRQHCEDFKSAGEKPLLFVMAENTKDADAIAERLQREPDLCGAGHVLLIHTDKTGEITAKELDKARELARTVDSGKAKARAVVSVMMLREGWDVRNVTVILGLRPFSAKARILPEQAVGRGLRLMRNVAPDNNQVLELIGTNAFENFIKELEGEGVGIPTTTTPPKPGVTIMPVSDREMYNIHIPQTSALYQREYRKLSELDPLSLPPLSSEENLSAEVKNRVELIHGIVQVKVGTDEVEFNAANLPPIESILAALTRRVEKKAKLTGFFAELYPKVAEYIQNRCFGGMVALDDAALRRELNHSDLLEAVAVLFSRAIGELTAKPQPVKLQGDRFSLYNTAPFMWRRMTVDAAHTVFNKVACFNALEADFATFLDSTSDIERFSSLSEWYTRFCIQYLDEEGGIRLYYPDFVAIQKTNEGLVRWILETKGREFANTDAKAQHMTRWCQDVKKETGENWRYLKVRQIDFAAFTKEHPHGSFQKFLDWLEKRDQQQSVLVLG
jgi:type III restriction enzyme